MCVWFWERKEEIEWIRASKLPYFTDDNGDAQMFKGWYTDSDGQEHQTNYYREYVGGHLEEDNFSAAAMGAWTFSVLTAEKNGELKYNEERCIYMFTIYDKG